MADAIIGKVAFGRANTLLARFAEGFDPFLSEYYTRNPGTPEAFSAPRSELPFGTPRCAPGKPRAYVVGTVEEEVVGGPGPDIERVFRICTRAPIFMSKGAAKRWAKEHDEGEEYLVRPITLEPDNADS
jgi:hypothetical protein